MRIFRYQFLRDLLLAAMVLASASHLSALPDLIPWSPSVNAFLSVENYTTATCSVQENCVIAGTRQLLRFNTETRNIGPDDVILGNPVGNPLFTFAPCHNHYHFIGYASYRLIDTTGTVALGYKEGFCLLDTFRFNPAANPTSSYNCNNQGLQSGWADFYSSSLPCQYIDVTGLPAGNYTLETTINPEFAIAEADFVNNTMGVSISLPGSPPVPSNDSCSSATVIANGTVTGDTTSASYDGYTACGSSSSSNDVWYQYTPPASGTAVFSTCGSALNTVLTVFTGSPFVSGNQIACNDTSAGPNCSGGLAAEISLPVAAGVPYLIRIAGSSNAIGTFTLSVAGPTLPSGIGEWPQFASASPGLEKQP